ncbi:UPF0711 protein like [Actinidia chinensis var. chinensis]|uniref:UPF0711 protein like n=1 Tax=Actinidia chinensis var. chinensis TaxID=1590841 RepID=A0A2R6RJH5_ACTCC|nr:UPF0711 protein like [Actinidia chinensis var. chinensis]
MKREGRQHGSVRSYPILPSPLNPRPESRFVNRFDSAPTAGLFTRVSSKPTNHSKYTGRCGRVGCVGCHLHPASKSKDKAKGTQKLRSCDVVSNHRLVTWRIVDSKPGFKVSGFSATGILDHLDSDDGYMDGDEIYEDSCGLDHHDSVEVEISSGAIEIEDKDGDEIEDKEDKDGDEIEDTSFYDVALVWEPSDEGEEDWCLVGEM